MAGIADILAIRFGGIGDGPVNAATNSPSCRHCRRRWLYDFLVADDPGGYPVEFAPRLHAEPGQRYHDVQRRRMFFLPCRARPARSLKARRRARHSIAVRNLLRAEYLT